MTDIVDEIDRLVDEQLAAGEPQNGYDYGDPQYPRCPNCGRHWHGLPLTRRVALMYALGHYDENYRADADTSPVLCPGSNAPRPADSDLEPRFTPGSITEPLTINITGNWLDDLIAVTAQYAAEALTEATGITVTPQQVAQAVENGAGFDEFVNQIGAAADLPYLPPPEVRRGHTCELWLPDEAHQLTQATSEGQDTP